MAAPTYVTQGSASSGSTTAVPSYPSGIQDGDLLVLFVANKYPTNGPATPSGWTAPSGNQATGGAGAAGAGQGDVYITVFTRQADGTESGSVSLSITSGNATYARMFVYRPQITRFSTFSVECQSGADNTADTSWSVTTGSIGVQPDDVIIAGSAVNSQAYTYTAQDVSVSGITFATAVERNDNGTATGDDVALMVSEHTATAGTATAAATYTATASGSTTNAPAGATMLVRIREVEATSGVALFQQEVSTLLDDVPGQARLYAQEVSVLVLPPDPDATVTPSTVSAVAAVPSSVETAGSTVNASVVAGVATVGSVSVTAGTGASVAASVVSAVTNVPAPISVGTDPNALVEAFTVTGAATVAGPTLTADAVTAPTTVAAAATVGSPTVRLSSQITPATVAAVGAVGSATVTTTSTVTPTTVAGTATVGAVAAGPITIATPATVLTAVTVGEPARPPLRYVGTYTDYVGTTTVYPNPPSPAAATGDLLVCMLGVRGDGSGIVTPTGWTLLSAASGTSTNGTPDGVDVGDMSVRVYWKLATGDDQPAISVGSFVLAIAKTYHFQLAAQFQPSLDAVFIDDPTAGTTFGGDGNDTLYVSSGDHLIVAGIIPTDSPRFSAQAVTIGGATIGLYAETIDAGTSLGNDLGTNQTVWTVSGTALDTPNYTSTATIGTNTYGAIAMVRVSAQTTATPATVAASATVGFAVVEELQVSTSGVLVAPGGALVLDDDRTGFATVITSPTTGSLVTSGGLTIYGTVIAGDLSQAEMHAQVSTSSTFASVLAEGYSAGVYPDETAAVSLSGLTAGVTYYLRARSGLSATAEWGDWSTTVVVTASADVGQGVAYLYASDVDTSVPTPHVWWTIYDPVTGDVTVVGTGFGATAGTYNGELWGDTGSGAVELTPSSWDESTATGDATTADREIVFQSSADPAVVTIVAPAPSGGVGAETGLATYVVTDSGGAQQSETVVYFPSGSPQTNPGSDWWIEVRDFFDPSTIITKMFTFRRLSFTRPLNDVGYGEIEISRADPFCQIELTPTAGDETEGKGILTFPLYFSFMYDGAERFRMLYEGKDKDRAKANEPETVVLSGSGRATQLAWGVVLPNNWPTNDKARPRVREDVTWAQTFIPLFHEAKDRGEIPSNLTLGFTQANDSYGQPWDGVVGTSDREVEIGSNLLDILTAWSDAEEFDWMVTPGGVIHAAPILGYDLTETVRFFNAVTNNEVGAVEDRRDLRTRVYVEGNTGRISYVESDFGMARWGVRAMYLRSEEAKSERQRLRVARGTLRQTRRPQREKSVKVPITHRDPVTGDSYGRTLFVDYGLGDLIGLGPLIDNETLLPLTSRNVRVQEIGIEVVDGQTDVDLMVETRLERFEERVRRLLALRFGAWSSAKTARIGKTPVGNLRDTDAEFPERGDSLVYDNETKLWKSGRVTDVWPFWYNGPLVETQSKMYLPVDANRRILRVTAELGDPSNSGAVVLRLKRNNIGVHTMTISANDRRQRDADLSIPLTPDDKLSLDIIDAGTNAGYLQFTVEAGL
jgi:hypothetical protein